MRNRLPEVILVLVLAATPSSAAQVSVTGAWMRALPAKLPAGGYFTAHNSGKNEIALTGAQSNACGMLMLHRSADTNGMDQMSDVASVPIAAGGSVSFSPGGYHLMCMDPAPSLKPGATVPVTLQFSDGSTLQVPFAVKNARGK